MERTQDTVQPTTQRRGMDRGLMLLIGSALLLITAALISIPLTARRTATLAPATTPNGVVQRFYQALYQDDYSAAHALLSSSIQDQLSADELQEQQSSNIDNSQMSIRETTINGTQATVKVTMTYYRSGGIFDSGEWNSEEQVRLTNEQGQWKIVDGPFYVPGAETAYPHP
jgi:hypothetical protein